MNTNTCCCFPYVCLCFLTWALSITSSPEGRIVYSPVVSLRSLPPFSQDRLGWGTPSARHTSCAWLFSTTMTSRSPPRMEGGTANPEFNLMWNVEGDKSPAFKHTSIEGWSIKLRVCTASYSAQWASSPGWQCPLRWQQCKCIVQYQLVGRRPAARIRSWAHVGVRIHWAAVHLYAMWLRGEGNHLLGTVVSQRSPRVPGTFQSLNWSPEGL